MTQYSSSLPLNPTPDQSAAHELLSDLRTRIVTQPLAYQYGLEARALESLWEVFAQARAAMKKYPGCEQFTRVVTRVLNMDLRPVTAKWFGDYQAGRLNSRDGADEFRGDLAEVQARLRAFAVILHEMAYGTKAEDELTPPIQTVADLDACFQDITFGLPRSSLIPDATVDAINESERGAIHVRRRLHGIEAAEGQNAVGLALSGGDIRSAIFCLGVVQVLAARRLLKDVDFLSTVSGGGYAGSFLTMRLGNRQSHDDVAGPKGPDPAPIHQLRQSTKFLAVADLKQSWSMATAAFAGMLLNWTPPLLLIVIAALAAIAFRNALYPGKAPWRTILEVSGGFTLVALVLYCWLIRKGRRPANFGGNLLGLTAAITVLLGLSWLLDIGYDAIGAAITTRWEVSAIAAGLAAAGPVIIRLVPEVKATSIRKIILKVLLGLVVPLAVVALLYSLWFLGAQSAAATVNLACLAVLLALLAMLLNVNLTGLHRLYRDQLARTFIQTDSTSGPPIPVTDINPAGSGPYHLINTTLNIPSSNHRALRDRKSDFFVFSKHWCGSITTGYFNTSAWKTNTAPVDLATAMTISGAAAWSLVGFSSMSTLTTLSMFLNARWSFWILRPDRKKWRKSPGFSCLLREMTGLGMAENQVWLNLSDGGHLENMAVYELLRRRCKYIVCVDGETDPHHRFPGFMTLVRHAQIDLGIRIDAKLGDIRPDPKTGYSQTHSALCRVLYPNGAIGLLLYMKLSLTGNETELIRFYHTLHPDFPHQSSLGQFFDEEQFEVYRQLGVHIAEGLFSRALMGGALPASVPQWFRRLAPNLLMPAGA